MGNRFGRRERVGPNSIFVDQYSNLAAALFFANFLKNTGSPEIVFVTSTDCFQNFIISSQNHATVCQESQQVRQFFLLIV